MRLGIDLGGTKTEIVALGADGAVLARERSPTPRGDYAGILRAVAGLALGLEARLGTRGSVGVGIPGAISPATGLVKNANTTELIGHAFDRDLAQALARPVRVENDANCFALSEASDGAGAGAHTVFGVILGTGVGGGVVVGGQVLRGRHAIAGEWGHNPLPWPDAGETATAPACYCGKAGCIETWLSGPAFAADVARAEGRAADAAAIVAAAEAGEDWAERAYRRYADRLARALASVVNLLDPDAIVLGGGMGRIARLYDDLPRLLPRYVFSDACDTPVRAPVHGDSSGVRGAAWLWPAS